MRERLAKLSCVSDRIRKHALTKKAGVMGSAAKGALNLAINKPLQTALGVGMGGLGIAGTAGTYKKHKTKFDPEVSRALMGEVPVPPGEG